MRLFDVDEFLEHLSKAEVVEVSWRNKINRKLIPVSTVTQIIIEMPAVESDRQVGEWVHNPDEWQDECVYECSQCGEPWLMIDDPEENVANFCPRCGSYNRKASHKKNDEFYLGEDA